MKRVSSPARTWLPVVALLGSSLWAGDVFAQSHASGALQPVLLTDAYLAESGWLLLPSRSLDVAALAATPEASRLAAYRDFERALRERTGHIVGGPVSVEERRRAKRRVLADVGARLERLPGAAVFHHGERIWRSVESKTDFAFDGFRVRLRVDEAVEGKLALKVQKKLR